MAVEIQPALRLAPEASITWTIPRQEWDAYVREQRKLVGLSIGSIGLLIGWMLMFVGFIGFRLWMLVTTSGGQGHGDGWLILGATALLYCSITAGIWTVFGRSFLRVAAYRRRGALVWERHGCVCPTCLKPFDTDGRATCRHRVAACQQPTILRILEAEATEDEPRETELRRLLELDARRLGIASRGRGPLQLLRRLNAREPDAFSWPARATGRCITSAVFIGLFWVAAGWAIIAWIPTLCLLAIASRFGQRARRHVHGRVMCTKCGHIIDDLARTSLCSECGADLTRIGGVRSAKIEVQQNLALAGWATTAVALVWGFYLAPLSVRVLPTGVLIAAINASVGSAEGFIDALAMRTLTAEESVAAANATLRWNARNPFARPSMGTLPFVLTPETLASLTDDTVDALTDISVHPGWLVGARPASAIFANGATARVREGTNAYAVVKFELGPRLPAAALIVVRTTNIAVVRSSDQVPVTAETTIHRHRTDVFRLQGDETTPEISIADLPAGRYDITVTFNVRFLPPMPAGWTSTPVGVARIDATLDQYPMATRTATLALQVE